MNQAHIKIPESVEKLIWYGKVDKEIDSIKIITIVLNKGSFDSIKWVFDNYSQNVIKDVVCNPLKGQWDRKSLNLWTNFFNIILEQDSSQNSIVDVSNF